MKKNYKQEKDALFVGRCMLSDCLRNQGDRDLFYVDNSKIYNNLKLQSRLTDELN